MCCHNSGCALMIFLKVLHSERCQEVQQNYVSAISEKVLLGAIGPFWTQNSIRYPHNSRFSPRVFLKGHNGT